MELGKLVWTRIATDKTFISRISSFSNAYWQNIGFFEAPDKKTRENKGREREKNLSDAWHVLNLNLVHAAVAKTAYRECNFYICRTTVCKKQLPLGKTWIALIKIMRAGAHKYSSARPALSGWSVGLLLARAAALSHGHMVTIYIVTGWLQLASWLPPRDQVHVTSWLPPRDQVQCSRSQKMDFSPNHGFLIFLLTLGPFSPFFCISKSAFWNFGLTFDIRFFFMGFIRILRRQTESNKRFPFPGHDFTWYAYCLLIHSPVILRQSV